MCPFSAAPELPDAVICRGSPERGAGATRGEEGSGRGEEGSGRGAAGFSTFQWEAGIQMGTEKGLEDL